MGSVSYLIIDIFLFSHHLSAEKLSRLGHSQELVG